MWSMDSFHMPKKSGTLYWLVLITNYLVLLKVDTSPNFSMAFGAIPLPLNMDSWWNPYPHSLNTQLNGQFSVIQNLTPKLLDTPPIPVKSSHLDLPFPWKKTIQFELPPLAHTLSKPTLWWWFNGLESHSKVEKGHLVWFCSLDPCPH